MTYFNIIWRKNFYKRTVGKIYGRIGVSDSLKILLYRFIIQINTFIHKKISKKLYTEFAEGIQIIHFLRMETNYPLVNPKLLTEILNFKN